ncbi:hypothetical protein GCM10027037_17720 [Mucilaginibacter koreensis]
MTSDKEKNEYPGEEMSSERFNPNNPFSVPSGYFDELDQRIMSSVFLNELKERTLEEGFTLPEGYFEASADQINSRIHIEELAASDAESFTVPGDDYFSRLQQQITSRIAIEEMAPAAEEAAFAVPEGYFDTLNKSILNKTVNQDMVMRKGIIRKLVSTAAFKYASAACFALIIGAGIFLAQSNSSSTTSHATTYLHKELAEIPADDIESYLETHMDPSDVQRTINAEGASVDYNALDKSLNESPAKN